MGETTHISWADHTFNPWIGCMKVSPACDGCYAENLMATRYGRVSWGAPGQGAGTRERTAAANWKKPLAWNRKAAKDGTRPFVFCASLADVFDNAVPDEWRRDLFKLINATPHLTWLLLTKRPQLIERLWCEACPEGHWGWPRNAAIGCTVVTQEEADRDVPALLRAKASLNPAFAFLSMEPLLGPVDLTRICLGEGPATTVWPNIDRMRITLNALTGAPKTGIPPIDGVITGGETDQGTHKARPTATDWFRTIRDQCEAAGVAYHHKQNGEWTDMATAGIGQSGPVTTRNGAVRDWLRQRVVFSDQRQAVVQAHSWTGHHTDLMFRVGKARAGRLLDGVVHDARPAVRA